MRKVERSRRREERRGTEKGQKAKICGRKKKTYQIVKNAKTGEKQEKRVGAEEGGERSRAGGRREEQKQGKKEQEMARSRGRRSRRSRRWPGAEEAGEEAGAEAGAGEDWREEKKIRWRSRRRLISTSPNTNTNQQQHQPHNTVTLTHLRQPAEVDNVP